MLLIHHSQYSPSENHARSPTVRNVCTYADVTMQQHNYTTILYNQCSSNEYMENLGPLKDNLTIKINSND